MKIRGRVEAVLVSAVLSGAYYWAAGRTFMFTLAYTF